MGITSFSVTLLQRVIKEYNPKDVMELGAQNLYISGKLPAPYAHEWYRENNMPLYSCIDLNGENGALKLDLEKTIKHEYQYELVTDFGTGEHIRNAYSLFKNIHNLTKLNGIIVRENPKTGSWPNNEYHISHHYMTLDFYKSFCELTGYKLIDSGEHAAMGNITDGWNVWAIMQKTSEKFPTQKAFNEIEICGK